MANQFDIGDPKAFIFHHSGGRETPSGLQSVLKNRGLGVQYIMDRNGNITQIGGAGESHIRPGTGVGSGLSNANAIGMEVIARDNKDVTPQQVAAARTFIEKNYPNLPIYGHGEVNPGHKQPDEGLAIVNAIRNARASQQPPLKPPLNLLGFQSPANSGAQSAQQPFLPANAQKMGAPIPPAPIPNQQPFMPASAMASAAPQPPLFSPQQQSQQPPPTGQQPSSLQSLLNSLPAGPQSQSDLVNWWNRQNPQG